MRYTQIIIKNITNPAAAPAPAPAAAPAPAPAAAPAAAPAPARGFLRSSRKITPAHAPDLAPAPAAAPVPAAPAPAAPAPERRQGNCIGNLCRRAIHAVTRRSSQVVPDPRGDTQRYKHRRNKRTRRVYKRKRTIRKRRI